MVDNTNVAAAFWLTTGEAAALLRITTQSLRKLIHAGDIPASRLGAVELRISRDAIDTYLRGRPVKRPASARDGRRNGRRVGRPATLPARSTSQTAE